MSEDRIAALEESRTQLLIAQARMEQTVQHLSKTVENLTTAVDKLTENMQRGKGALWMFGALAGTVGGVVPWVMTLIFQTK